VPGSHPAGAEWTVRLSRRPVRAIGQLPPKVAAAVIEFITTTLPTNPHPLSKPLRHRRRVGSKRCIRSRGNAGLCGDERIPSPLQHAKACRWLVFRLPRIIKRLAE
jgi:hypothetical protein